jgi:hypothetical protein
VYHPVSMHIINTTAKLIDNDGCFGLCQSFPLFEYISQLAITT